MKKIIITVAAAISLGIGLVNAEELKVNFDGTGKGNASLLETVRNGAEGSGILIPGFPARSWHGDVDSPSRVAGVFPSAGNNGTEILGIPIKGISKQEILREVLKQYLSAKSNKDNYPVDLLERSDTQILFDEENVYIQTKSNNISLYAMKNRALVNTIKVVLSKNISQNKQYCELIEKVLLELMWREIEKVWTQVWVETKKLVEVCRDGNPPSTPNAPYVCPSPMAGCTMDSNCRQLCQ